MTNGSLNASARETGSCIRCGAPRPIAIDTQSVVFHDGFCPECNSNFTERAESYGGSQAEIDAREKRFMREFDAEAVSRVRGAEE